MKILYASHNPGKIKEVRGFFADQDVTVYSPSDLGIAEQPVAEDADTFEANAIQKWQAYVNLAPDDVWVVGDDGGIEIEALNGAPGVRTRRWKDGKTRLSDQEIVEHAQQLLDGQDNRRAAFRLVLAYGRKDEQPKTIEAKIDGELLRGPVKTTAQPGYPFRAYFYLPSMKKMLYELHDTPRSKRPDFLTQREAALQTLHEAINQTGKS